MTMDLGFYLKIFLRRLPYFLIMVVIGAAAGLSMAVILPPVYNASSRLLVESEQIPGNLAASTVQTEAGEALQIIRQRILTRETLLEMSNRLGIYEGQDDAPLSADDKVSDLRRRIDITTSGGGRRGQTSATFVNVGFEAPSGRLAATVANELVTLILRENVEMRTATAGQTLDFFEQEVDRLDQELSRLGARILEFKRANLNALPDSLDFRRSQQSALQERLSQMQREEAVLKDRRERLVTLYETTGRVEPVAQASLSPEARRLNELQDEYSNSIAVLSPENPKMSVLRARIAALEKVVTEQQASAAATGATDGDAPSPYEIQLADLDNQISYLVDRQAQVQETMDGLAETIEATPGNQITLQTLERDYSNVRSQYDQAVSARAKAETGDIIESLSKGQRISVIEQANTPRMPTSPNRPLIAMAGLGAGVGAGLAFVLLLELLNSAVRRPVELTSKLGITAFGTVPYIRTREQVRARRMVVVLGLLAALIVIPAGLWLIDTQVMPLAPLLDRILGRIGLALATGDPAPVLA